MLFFGILDISSYLFPNSFIHFNKSFPIPKMKLPAASCGVSARDSLRSSLVCCDASIGECTLLGFNNVNIFLLFYTKYPGSAAHGWKWRNKKRTGHSTRREMPVPFIGFGLSKLSLQLLKQIPEQPVPIHMVDIPDEMPSVVKGVLSVVLRDGAVDQVVLHEVPVQEPGHGSDIPDDP